MAKNDNNEKAFYDRERPIYSHKQGKALRFGEAWVDHYIEFGCDPDIKTLYMEHVASEGTVDKFDITDDESLKRIDARNCAHMFCVRYGIKEWVKEQKAKQTYERSSLVKEDYISILNAMVLDTTAPLKDRRGALQQVTKMLGIEGASKIESEGGFCLNIVK